MSNYKKILILIILLTIIIILFILYFKNLYAKEIIYIPNGIPQYIVYLNEYTSNGKNRKDWIYYYNKNYELIKKYNFNSKEKVPNQIKIKDKIYSYGYGGIYETDLNTMQTIPINTEAPVNLIKYDLYGNIYIYQNVGYENDFSEYTSIILKNNEKYIEVNYAIVDFCIYNEYLYITVYNDISLKDGKILIYKDKVLTKEIDVSLENGEGNWAILNDNIFFLSTNYAYKITNQELKKIPYENANSLSRPLITNNLDFSKLFINSTEVFYKDNKLIFSNDKIKYINNFDIEANKSLNCYFDKKNQLLFLNEKQIKLRNSFFKSNFVYLSAFEI